MAAMWIGSARNGLGAGAIFPASLALVAAVTHNARERAKGIAMWAGFLSVGAALSPILGGVFAGQGVWRGAYGESGTNSNCHNQCVRIRGHSWLPMFVEGERDGKCR